MQKHQTKNGAANSALSDEGLGTKKTIFVLCVVVGCIGILWPKLFYPMFFGNTSSPPLPQSRGSVKKIGKCCDVVLDKDKFFNASLTAMAFGPDLFRRHDKMYQDELSLRQERPPHLRDGLHPAMRERGRAIPDTQTIPIIERQKYPPPKIVEGRPGPIPGMRPPMGAGNMKAQQKAATGSMGIIMPIYTIAIVLFFLYTLSKIMGKKSDPNAPYETVEPNPEFRKEVFGKNTANKAEKTKLASNTNTESRPPVRSNKEKILECDNQLMEIQKLRLKLEETEKAMAKLIEEMTSDKAQSKVNGTSDQHSGVENLDVGKTPKHEQKSSDEKSVKVLGMELSASWGHNGSKWTGRPPTPIFASHFEHSKLDDEDMPAPESIYLEGSLPPKSQILVADSETHTEEVTDQELNGSAEEPAVILSSKMTLSLINLDTARNTTTTDVDSPLADDIEIIGDDEKSIS
ncbi:hypothetical protein ACFFRR_008786 [Megaselia abdita]